MLPCTRSCEAAGEAGESGTLIWGKREPWKLAAFVPVSALLELLLPVLYLHVLLHMIILQFRSRFLVCCVFVRWVRFSPGQDWGWMRSQHCIDSGSDTDG